VTYVSADCGTGLLRALMSYVSQVRRRSQRRRTAPGRGQDEGCVLRGKPPRRCGGTPPQRG
ncbi:MAG: hypothetical protein LBM98_00780, partial [Oscillospiraceae bacterium]|nr:hypothetical protein [Oscillospiraceae bacterium]